MKPYIILSTLIILTSCSTSDNSKLENDLKINITSRVKQIDSTAKIDSCRLIRIDSISMYEVLNYKARQFQLTIDSLQFALDTEIEKANNYLSIARLSKGLSKPLYDNYLQQAIDCRKTIDGQVELMIKLRSSDSVLIDQMSKADRIKPAHLQATCLVQYSRADRSVAKDTMYVILNNEKKIVRMEDLACYN